MNSDRACSKVELENAFQVFNDMSSSLATSYQELQQRVMGLHEELAFSHDERVTELAERERLAIRLANLLETLPAGVIVLDREGVMQAFNPAAIGFLGSLQPGDSWAAIINSTLQSFQGSGSEFQLADGRVVSIGVRTLEDETGQIVLISDVTDTVRLQEMIERQKRLTSMGEMVAGMAHQIRTPLASALLYTNHLSSNDLTRAERKKVSARLVARLRHMEQQVNDMLSFARGEKITRETMNVAEWLVEVEAAIRHDLVNQEVRLEVIDHSQGCYIDGNANALLGAVLNLANNAIETGYRPLHLMLSVRQLEDRSLEIEFSDDGPGMDDDIVEKVFEPFYTTRIQGTGLGLAVVRSVVEAHQGSISLSTASGLGTCFLMRFPASDVAIPLPSSVGECAA